MATTVGTRIQAAGRPAPASTATRPGRLPMLLSAGLAIDAAVAAVASALRPDLIRGPEVAVGQLQGTALVLVAVTIPVLLLSMAASSRGSVRGQVLWLGAVGSITYQAVLFLFATPFNPFFLLYVAMLSLGVWSVVALTLRISPGAVAARASERMPVRALAIYIALSAAAFAWLWLSAVVPALLASGPPAFLEGTGLLTGPVQIIDLAFTLPLMFLSAAWLASRRPWGFVVAGALLVMLAIETASIASDQWFGHQADPASPAASVDLVPVMGGLTIIGIVAAGIFLRHLGGEQGRS